MAIKKLKNLSNCLKNKIKLAQMKSFNNWNNTQFKVEFKKKKLLLNIEKCFK